MNRRGMTLIEMLLAMVVFLLFLGGAMAAMRGQLLGLRRGSDEAGILQNLRYGVDQLTREIRAAGANTPDQQPALVYAGGATFSFNADLISNLAGDISAVYVDVAAPAGQVSALSLAGAITIPGSAPAFSYPAADYGTSPAETITFTFTADPETPRADDFVLLRQVNARPPEVLVRNILAPAGGNPFFRYFRVEAPAGGSAVLNPVPDPALPLRHSVPLHGQLPDTGGLAGIDNLRAVQVSYRVTDGRVGVNERIRAIRTVIPLPNVGVKKLKACGDEPLFGIPVVATPVVDAAGARVELAWGPSPDEAAGEQDVIRYAIWRRSGGGEWGDPFASLPSGAPPYLYTDPDVVSGGAYQYAVAAQDCTPRLSPWSVSAAVVIP